MTDQTSEVKTPDLGKALLQQGLITEAQLSSALASAARTQKSMEETVVDLEMITEEDIARARAKMYEIPYIGFADIKIDPALLPLVDAQIGLKYLILPIGRRQDGTIRLAVAAWSSDVVEAATKVANTNRTRIAPVIANERQVREAVEEHYGHARRQNLGQQAPQQFAPPTRSSVPAVVSSPAAAVPNRWATAAPGASGIKAKEMFSSGLPASISQASGANDLENIGEMSVEQPIVIQTVNQVLAQGINRGASDIHFEPRRDRMDIRYRIDGTLHFVDSVREEYKAACVSRVKIMADMNITERRLPQDGRISVTMNNRNVDMRVSSLPTQYGESMVLRILDKGATRPGLDQLGFSERNLRVLNNLIRKPHGIFLATGPTGSGKTTTLYSAIQAIHTPEVNIITVEDPIEYDLDGIRQSNVHEKSGLTFARQLRAILRQDPDVIYVGEIRDAETADISFRAALTGHLVFSTLHCNDAPGAVTRLLNMDMDPFLVASTVVGVMAQRLVRRVCSTCARPYRPTKDELENFGVDTNGTEFRNAHFVMGAGCDACDQTGYKGRCSVQEIMVMDDAIRNMILQRLPSNKIRTEAMIHGMTSMRQDAASKVMQGLTTFEEAQKRVFIEDGYDDKPPAY